ncbi:unnamed protein product [Eruca vesicaria subsp. sativa]|uniref:Glabrous enhancer-binding protein-like DBD domain-containing protein n=1 Tax=Eruca vesicaria subsp. sativa TaxID=29727 RepID=A0ABC8LTU5_ERUVS|nr:unnamed protein product [Eruca vesicaria subsp. sativa]
MVLGKRTREHSIDSNSNCFETLLNHNKPISSSPLRSMQEDDVSGMEAMLRRRKQPKTTPLSSSSKMTWTKDDELIILGSIVDYEKETKLSYKSDWDAFYEYVKDFIESEFSKKQLFDKIRNLSRRFLGNKARCNDEEGPSFTSTEDDEIFKLSMIIWDTANETASDENVDKAKDVPCVENERFDENIDQGNVVSVAPCVENEPVDENMDQTKDLPFVEDERVDENIDQAKADVPFVEDERVDENVDQAKVLAMDNDAPCLEHERANGNMDLDQEKDVPCEEQERVNKNMDEEEAEPVSDVSIETDKGEKEKIEEDGVDELCALKDAITEEKEEKEKSEEEGVDEFCALKDALTDREENEKSEEDGDEYCALKDALEEATTLFQSISKYQQKLMLQKLTNLGAQRKKELVDEWKELLDEEMKFIAKKLSLSAKLASIADSF